MNKTSILTYKVQNITMKATATSKILQGSFTIKILPSLVVVVVVVVQDIKS